MGGVAGDHQQKGLDDRVAGFAGVGFQLDFNTFVQAHTVFQLHALDFVGRHAGRVEVFARDDGWLFHKAIGHGLAERVVVHNIFEWRCATVAFDIGCGGEFQPKDGPQLVDRANTGAGAIAVRFVHQQHQVRQVGKVIEVAFANVFRQALDTGGFAAAHFGVDL